MLGLILWYLFAGAFMGLGIGLNDTADLRNDYASFLRSTGLKPWLAYPITILFYMIIAAFAWPRLVYVRVRAIRSSIQ